MSVPFNVVVELFYDAAWQDITNWVQQDQGISGRRGRGQWTDRVSPGEYSIVLRDDDLRWFPDNPMSPVYGKVGENTPLRITVEGHRRFVGEIGDVLPGADTSGNHRTATVKAYGKLRQLETTNTERSALRLSMATFDPQPDGYWALEDGELSIEGQSSLLNRPAMKPLSPSALGSPQIEWASNTDLPGATTAPTLKRGILHGELVPPSAATDSWTVACAAKAGVNSTNDTMLTVRTPEFVGAGIFQVSMFPPEEATSDPLRVVTQDDIGTTTIMTHEFFEGQFENIWHHYAVTAAQSGSDIQFRLYVDGALVSSHLRTSSTLRRLDYVQHWVITDGYELSPSHTMVWHSELSASDIASISAAVHGYPGERAGRRIERICLEEGIPLSVAGSLDSTQRMGPQRSGKALDIMHDAARAAGAPLYEALSATRAVGQFESETTEGWVGGGSPAPSVSVSSAEAHSGAWSLRVVWGGGSDLQLLQRSSPQSIFVPGIEYTYSAWVKVPAGSPNVVAVVAGVGFGTTATVKDDWEQISVTWTATSITHAFQIWAVGTTSFGELFYVDDIIVLTEMPALSFRTLNTAYNRNSKLTVDGTQGELPPGFTPSKDVQSIANHIRANRVGGATYEAIANDPQLHGRLNTLPPSQGGVGVYERAVSTNVQLDHQAYNRAYWERHLGTWDELRMSRIAVNLARDPHLVDQAAVVDVFDRIDAVPPDRVPSGIEIDQIVQGYTENLSTFRWTIEYNTTPFGPMHIGVVEEPDHRFDSDYTTLAHAVGSMDTSYNVAVELGRCVWVDSTTYASEFPFDVKVGGERMTVSGITEMASDHRPAASSVTTASTSHTAPSVTPIRPDALLLCAWQSFNSVGDYTVPGTMTLDTETDGPHSTMVTATQIVPAGATGTRVASFSVSDEHCAVTDSYDAAAGITLESSDSGVADGSAVVLNSGPVRANWFIIAVHGWNVDGTNLMAAPTGASGWVSLNSSTASANTSRIRVWALQVLENVDNMEVTFAGLAGRSNHARLYAVSGQFEQRFTVTRSVNDVVKPHSIGDKVSLYRRRYVGL